MNIPIIFGTILAKDIGRLSTSVFRSHRPFYRIKGGIHIGSILKKRDERLKIL